MTGAEDPSPKSRTFIGESSQLSRCAWAAAGTDMNHSAGGAGRRASALTRRRIGEGAITHD